MQKLQKHGDRGCAHRNFSHKSLEGSQAKPFVSARNKQHLRVAIEPLFFLIRYTSHKMHHILYTQLLCKLTSFINSRGRANKNKRQRSSVLFKVRDRFECGIPSLSAFQLSDKKCKTFRYGTTFLGRWLILRNRSVR